MVKLFNQKNSKHSAMFCKEASASAQALDVGLLSWRIFLTPSAKKIKTKESNTDDVMCIHRLALM